MGKDWIMRNDFEGQFAQFILWRFRLFSARGQGSRGKAGQAGRDF